MGEIFIRIGIAALLQSVKNPAKKDAMKGICRVLVRGVILAYADDEDFLTSLAGDK